MGGTIKYGRHKHIPYKKIEEEKKEEKSIDEEEHKKKIEKLKELGLLK